MISIIGNSINSTNKKVLEKMNKMDFNFIEKEVKAQIDEGAEYIELNAQSLPKHEHEFLKESLSIVEENGGKALVRSNSVEMLVNIIDHASKGIIVGDIEFDKQKIDPLLDIVKEKDVKIIAASRKDDNKKHKHSPEHSLLIAQMYIDYLLDHDVERENILLDPVVKPLEYNYLNGRNFLNTLELFKLDFPFIKTIADLSILSMGLPQKQVISAHCVALAIEKGLDYVVLNILEKAIIESIICTLTIIGKDRNMKAYQNFCKRNKHLRN